MISERKFPTSILAFFDGSDSSRAALAFALDLAEGTGARATVAHVITPEAGFLSGLPSTEAEAERWLESAVKRESEGRAATADYVVTEARRPEDSLAELSGARGVDLVVVGKSGRGGVRRYLLGSSAERLLEDAACSVAAFPAEPASRSLSEIVVGIDGSSEAREALVQGAALSSGLSLPLRCAHVVNTQLPYPMDVGPTETFTITLERRGRELLAEAEGAVDELASAELRRGDPRKSLLELAEAEPTALLVVGFRGAGGFVGLRLGSTAWELVRRSLGPVAIAKAALG